MKKLLIFLVVLANIYSCSRDEERNFSAIEQLVGEWVLQSRVLNNTSPVVTDDEKINFSEDNDIRDYKGLFVIEAMSMSSGTFSISSLEPTMTFVDTNGNTIIYGFNLNTITLTLAKTNEDNDFVEEVWIKTSN